MKPGQQVIKIVHDALVEMLGLFASRVDAWVLAEGVETEAEAFSLVDLGVPLAQGWLFGRPAPPWASLDWDTAARLAAFGIVGGIALVALAVLALAFFVVVIFGKPVIRWLRRKKIGDAGLADTDLLAEAGPLPTAEELQHADAA